MKGKFRHPRHGFVCWLPRTDDTGMWPVRTWLFWTWEWIPPEPAAEVVNYMSIIRRRRA